jgi:Na+-translocating ferredoxin:NAD+ oxidoreductase RnfD subunit
MAVTEEEAKAFLSHKKIANISIVPVEITLVQATDARQIETLSFVSSLALLIAGILLGAIFSPSNPFFLYFIISGILAIFIGVIIFIWGVHSQISKWEKTKIPIEKLM